MMFILANITQEVTELVVPQDLGVVLAIANIVMQDNDQLGCPQGKGPMANTYSDLFRL
jgi:hypothetical protein